MPVNFISDDLSVALWLMFHQTYNSVAKYGERKYIAAGTTMQQYYILMAIKNGGKTTIPSQLSDWLNRNANSITMILDRMEKKGLIGRVRDLRDRRALRLVITPKGDKILKNGAKVERELINNLVREFSEDEIMFFTKQLEKIQSTAITLYYPKKKELKVIKIDN